MTNERNWRQRLAEAEEALRFYAAAPVNELELFRLDGEPNDVPDEDGDVCIILGKRARAYFAKYANEVVLPNETDDKS